MPIKPKYTLSGKISTQKKERKFTDREQFIEAFENAVKQKSSESHKILVYYGVGGIGKTTLRKKLITLLKEVDSSAVSTCIDLDTPTYREQETALFVLKNQLHRDYKINFPSFDIAYTVYWQKTHPQTPITKDNFPLLTGVSAVANIFRVVGEMPYIGFVPKLTKAFMTGGSVFREWWKKRGEKELVNLPSLEPKEISARLPMFWASDLKDYIEAKSKPVVIFLDTYEALWENSSATGGFFMRDEWVRELVSHLPEVLWVVCGREKLRWEEQDKEWRDHTEQYLIGRFSDNDSLAFLNSCEIKNQKVCDTICTASRGVPHFLDLAVDTYFEIKNRHNREALPEDFAKTQSDVLDRFLRYLDKNEIETLKVLSVARSWNLKIFSLLVTEFKTGYPLTLMNDLCRFSFIEKNIADKDSYIMQELMRESLHARFDKDSLSKVHYSLYLFYADFLNLLDIKNITIRDKKNFFEAFYHGINANIQNEFFEWYLKISRYFINSGLFRFLLPLSENFFSVSKEFFGNDSSQHIKALQQLAKLFELLGKYNAAEPLLKRALKYYENQGINFLDEKSKATVNLADLYFYQAKFNMAEPLYIKALKDKTNLYGEDNKYIADTMNNLANVYAFLGKYDESELLLKKALFIRERELGTKNPEVAKSIYNLANVYMDLKRYEEAEEYYKKSLKILIETLGDEHPEIGKINNNLGNLYLELKKLEKAFEYYNYAFQIFKKSLGEEHPETATTLNNLAYLNYLNRNYSEAEEYYFKALKILKNITGENHPNVAMIYENLGTLYKDGKNFNKAEEYFVKSLSIKKSIFGTEHPEVISTEKILKEIKSAK